MGGTQAPSGNPDLTQGVALTTLADGGMLLGHVGDEAVLLARRREEYFAVGATCTHYGGPLADGILVGETVRCPWHHACFSLRTGAVTRPPALNPVACWRVERRDGFAFVCERLPTPEPPARRVVAGAPRSVVIIGGGAAGNAAAEALRQEGYAGPVTLLSADQALPCDRPNLSKDYLAGAAQADWIPLRPDSFYREQGIDLRLGARVDAIDPAARRVRLADGSHIAYGALLLATGAEPVRLDVPGATLPHVHVLRSLADSDELIAAAITGRRCLVVGASFIGLEVAASLRARGLEVHVVAPEPRPMERIMGAAIGDMIRALHEAHGVIFHLSATVAGIAPQVVTLSTGAQVDADLVVVGIGVRPAIALAEQGGLTIDRGVTVDAYLETSAAGIFAAGDVARWPDRLTGQASRVEHWVVAQRQGQVAACNILGQRLRFDAVPFFWSQHYDTTVTYVGHAETWDRLDVDGDPAARDCMATFWRGGRKCAVVTIGRDRDSLRAEAAFEQEIAP
jgi:3-phenylpropionate/trans-cinnamate dioxygenase ferredoxin reductase subunit